MRLRPREKRPIIGMLQQAPLFSGLAEKELERIANKSVERFFRAGDPIVREGEDGVGFYLILEGSAEVRRSGKVLSRLTQGHFFGEMTVLDGQPRSADVIAVQETRCLVLNTWNFLGIVRAYPTIAGKILKELTRRLRATNKALTE